MNTYLIFLVVGVASYSFGSQNNKNHFTVTDTTRSWNYTGQVNKKNSMTTKQVQKNDNNHSAKQELHWNWKDIPLTIEYSLKNSPVGFEQSIIAILDAKAHEYGYPLSNATSICAIVDQDSFVTFMVGTDDPESGTIFSAKI